MPLLGVLLGKIAPTQRKIYHHWILDRVSTAGMYT